MDANSWTWIALIAFLIFCCLPMLFMRKRQGDSHEKTETKKGDKQQM